MSVCVRANRRPGQKSKGKISLTKLRLRFKISVSKPRLDDLLQELRDYNKDFETLSKQISRLKTMPLTLASSVQPAARVVHSQFKIAQQASKGLFYNLDSEWPCDEQTRHVASMSLRLGDCFQNKTSRVSFSLAVKCVQPASEKSVRLVIESAPKVAQDETKIVKATDHLQEALENAAGGKRVRFSLPVRPVATPNATTQVHVPQGTQIHGPFCQYFHNFDHSSVGDSCIEFPQKTESYKHIVYPKLITKPQGIWHTASLKEVLQSALKDKREVDYNEKLKLAKLLCLAVLQFHSTPWLSDSWSSNDIRFLWDEMAPHRLANPCVDVELSSATHTRAVSNLSQLTAATNESLFNLAIVLMELGYDSPFEALQSDRSDKAAENAEALAFRKLDTARKLCDALYSRRPMLDMRYRRLVEKCLYCDFERGRDLDDVELQKAVYFNVIGELDKCLEVQRQANARFPPLRRI